MESKNTYGPHSKAHFSSLDDLIITNQQVDDDYINNLYQKLSEMKKQRKSVEQATNLLNVRVNCLKNEEGKTVKQIELTKKKTREKLMTLQKNKLEELRKLTIQKEKENEQKAQKERIMKQKASIANGLIVKKEAKMRKVAEEAKLFKDQIRSISDFLKSMKNEEIINKKNNNEMIKTQQLINNEKKRAILLEKKSQIKIDLENKIKEELIIKAENDYKIQQLQAVEIEIVKRIQETTQMHKMLLQEFEGVILGGGGGFFNQIEGNCNDNENEEGDGEQYQDNYANNGGEEEEQYMDDNCNESPQYNNSSSNPIKNFNY